MLPAWQALDLRPGGSYSTIQQRAKRARGSTSRPRRIASLFLSSISNLTGPGYFSLEMRERFIPKK
jgi:hypothetical protein